MTLPSSRNLLKIQKHLHQSMCWKTYFNGQTCDMSQRIWNNQWNKNKVLVIVTTQQWWGVGA